MQDRPEAPRAVVGQRRDHLLLGAVVVVEGADREPGAADDVAHRRRLEPHLAEHGPRGVEDGLPVRELGLLALARTEIRNVRHPLGSPAATLKSTADGRRDVSAAYGAVVVGGRLFGGSVGPARLGRRTVGERMDHEKHEKHERVLYANEAFEVQGAIFEVSRELGVGFLEAVYQECLALEFAARGVPFRAKPALGLRYKGSALLQTYALDFVCFDRIIVELKAVREIAPEHRAQVSTT